MAETNAPPIRIPQAFMKDKELMNYAQELHSFLYLLWQRTGGGADLIEGASLDIAGLNAAVAALNASVEGLDDNVEALYVVSAQLEQIRAQLARLDDLEVLAYGD